MENITADIMTKDLSTINWSESLLTASQKMHRLNIRHLPVVDDYGALVGLISERDVQRERSARTDFVQPEFETIVRDYMTSAVEQISSDSNVQEVAHRMMAFKISAFVVVDRGELVGILTSDDLLRLLISLLDNNQNPRDQNYDRFSYYSPIGEIANFFSQAGI